RARRRPAAAARHAARARLRVRAARRHRCLARAARVAQALDRRRDRGHRDGPPQGALGVRLVVRAPATSANLGPGFDCFGAALELWNELEVMRGEGAVVLEGEGAAELPRGSEHLALRAFALVAPVEGHDFRFVNRIPLERGLGSSAATIACGLVAGLAAAGPEAAADQRVDAGLPLGGDPANLPPPVFGAGFHSLGHGPGRPAPGRPAATPP